MINLDFSGIELKLKQEEGKTCVFDPVRKKWLVLTPEEHVRQYLLGYLSVSAGYPVGMMSVEKQVRVGAMNKRFDIVIYDREHKPWMLVECKSPDVMITETALHQLLQYQNVVQCNYWVLTNGHQLFCADACDITAIKWLEELPSYK